MSISSVYEQYFGLEEHPFSITPDPRFVYLSDIHRTALEHLKQGAVGGANGFVLLTGDVGTGKTTLCRTFLEQVPSKTEVALILNPVLTLNEFLETICEEFDLVIEGSRESNKNLIDHLNRFLVQVYATGQKTILIVDEAQNLSHELLEEIRLLTNLETNSDKLLLIFLIGQPELREMLDRPDMQQVSQRITSRYHLGPLNKQDTNAYILKRLDIAGAQDIEFTPSAVRRIYAFSGGVPRLINVLCDKALLCGYENSTHKITTNIVKQAEQRVRGNLNHPGPGWGKAAAGLGIAGAAVAAALALGYALHFAGWTPWTEQAPVEVAVTKEHAPAATAPLADANVPLAQTASGAGTPIETQNTADSTMPTDNTARSTSSSGPTSPVKGEQFVMLPIDGSITGNSQVTQSPALPHDAIGPSSTVTMMEMPPPPRSVLPEQTNGPATAPGSPSELAAKPSSTTEPMMSEAQEAAAPKPMVTEVPAPQPDSITRPAGQPTGNGAASFTESESTGVTASRGPISVPQHSNKLAEKIKSVVTPTPPTSEPDTAQNRTPPPIAADAAPSPVATAEPTPAVAPRSAREHQTGNVGSSAKRAENLAPKRRARPTQTLTSYTQKAAQRKLLNLWGVDSEPPDNLSFCQFAQRNGLSCLNEQRGLKFLYIYNRPALISIKVGDLNSYAVVTKATPQKVMLDVLGRKHEFPADVMSRIWDGRFLLLYRASEEIPSGLLQGNQGEKVVRLRQIIDQIEGTQTTGDVYDAELASRIKQFQSKAGLRPDGIVGPRTLMVMQNRLAEIAKVTKN